MNFNWYSIRAIDGSQAIGFEELIAQLARTETPPDARFERVGTQDAGVECYCVLEDGGEWGWQAKYFTSSLTSSQWRQIDDSVETALNKHPGLVRYFVCVPWDRSDARIPRQKSAMQRWEEHVSKWEGWAQNRCMNVEFLWWGSSELVERLSQPEQIGRLFFWFDERYFDRAWYDNRLKEAIDSAGRRYTPEIHVGLPIARDLELFGRTDAAVDSIKALARDVRRDFRSVSLSREEKEEIRGKVNLFELSKSRDAILSSFADLRPKPIGELPLADIVERVGEALAECDKLDEPLENLSREYPKPKEIDGRSPYHTNPYRNVLHLISRLRYRLQEISDSVKHADEIANGRVMILKGNAGTGKTHLLCDVANSRIKEGAPTVLLMGQQFTDSTEPWTQALQQLDMPRDTTAEQFIGALEASAQAADQRALLIIDAVNEGRGREIWPPSMNAFLTRVGKSPWIGVIFSVRSSYEESVIPDNVRERAVSVTHTGFEGHEYDAVRIFSEQYDIEFPSTPILNPEFQNPLLLKIIFEGLEEAGERLIPRGFSGVTETFNLYLMAVNKRLSETLDYNWNDNLVRRSLESLVERMLEIDPTSGLLLRQQGEEVVNELLPGRGFSDSLYRGLILEGVLAEDMAWHDGESSEVVRFAYERFTDHKIVDLLLQKHLDVNDPKAAFAEGGGLAFISDRFRTPPGILEAMCIQVPERTGQELVRLAPSLLDDAWSIGDAFLQSIVWRKPDAFSDDTLNVLNELIQKGKVRDVFDTVLTVATIPEHYFNADSLDRTLRRRSMPDRDAWWSVYLHRAWQSGGGPVHRLVDWASSISTSDDVEDETVDLASTTLAWMFSASNRLVRDKATKALVSLLTGRTDATVRLLNRFGDVDDLYVRERVYAVVYGVVMRSQDAVGVGKLGQFVYETIFSSGNPPPHILLRDYARGVVERALYLNKDMAIDKVLLRPPYGSDWPRIPDDAELERLTPHWDDETAKWGTREWARNRIRASVMNYGDFQRYIIGANFNSPGSSHWLNKKLNEEMWRQQSGEFPGFDLRLIQRYIVQRVFDLGWTVKRFGDFDSISIMDQGRHTNQAERMGKKYQWIAYHEILAHMADNYQFSPEYKGSGEVFQGAWQNICRDIDPSAVPLSSASTAAFNRNHPPTWWASLEYNNWQISLAVKDWIADHSDFPALDKNLIVKVPAETKARWVNSYGWQRQHQLSSDIAEYDSESRKIWLKTTAYLVPKGKADDFVEWVMSGRYWTNEWVTGVQGIHDVFVGEHAWNQSYMQQYGEYDENPQEWIHPLGAVSVPAHTLIAIYSPKFGNYDCSIDADESMSMYLPSQPIVKGCCLRWNGTGATYTDCEGEVAAFDPSTSETGPNALLLRIDVLEDYMDARELELCWTVIGAKEAIGTTGRLCGWLEMFGAYVYRDGNVEGKHNYRFQIQ